MERDDAGERRELLADVCAWYYLDGRTQESIAESLGVSRSAVSRLLTEAQQAGVVEFKIHRNPLVDTELEEQLERRFGVRASVVAARESDPSTLRRMGRQAGSLVDSLLKPSGVLAISYGTSVYETVRQIPAHHFVSMQVVQIAGVEGALNPQIDGWELVRICADRLGARYLHLHSPLMASTPQMRDMFLDDPGVRKHMDLAAAADVAVVGIGSIQASESSLVRAGHLSAQQLDDCVRAGSVGYIGGRHYDRHGRPLDALNARTVSLPLERLADIPHVIAVAAGSGKVLGVLGALVGHHIDALVTDAPTAMSVMRAADETLS